MPIKIKGQTFYQTREATEMAGISRATLFRWLKNGTIKDTEHKDRRGWRLFTKEEIENLQAEANKIITTPKQEEIKLK